MGSDPKPKCGALAYEIRVQGLARYCNHATFRFDIWEVFLNMNRRKKGILIISNYQAVVGNIVVAEGLRTSLFKKGSSFEPIGVRLQRG